MSTPRRHSTKAAVVIRAFEPADIDACARIVNQPSVYSGTLQIPQQSLAELRERWTKADPLRRSLVVELDGVVIAHGGLHLSSKLRMRHVGGIGMMVAEQAQGRGLGGRLLDALLELGERWCGVLRFELEVWVDNVRAIQLYRSRGFVIEGVARAMGLRDGQLVDAFRMARVAESLPWPRVMAEDAAGRGPKQLPPSPRPRRRAGNGHN